MCVCVCVCARARGWAGACAGGVRFSNSNRIIPSDYRILLLLKMPIPNFNPLSSSTKSRLFKETDKDTQSTGGFLTFIPIMTITTIYTKKYMDINVYSFPHRLDVMIWNMNYLGNVG